LVVLEVVLVVVAVDAVDAVQFVTLLLTNQDVTNNIAPSILFNTSTK